MGDFSGLTAQGRPISAQSQAQKKHMTKFVRSMLNSRPSLQSDSMITSLYTDSRPQSGLSNAPLDRPRSVADSLHRPLTGMSDSRRPLTGGMGGGERVQSGKFVANFCQTVLTGGAKKEEVGGSREKEKVHEDGKVTTTGAAETLK